MKLSRALIAGLSLIALPLHATGLDDMTYTTTGGEVTITDCDEAATGELVIPDTIEGNPVTSIEGSTFWGCTSLTNITIPDGVTRIGAAAFLRCSSLTSITIPDSVTSIERSAFAYCTSLTGITIPDSVTSIGDYAFYKCSSLTSITIPDNVISIGINAFRDCTSLTDVTLPSGFSLRSMSSAFTDTPAQQSYQDSSEVTAMEEQIASLQAQLAAVTAERDALPTQASYDAVVADRDSRPTLAEVQDARVGSIILSKDWQSGEVSLCFGLQKTDDFVSWTAFEGGTWRDAPNGEFKLTLPLGEAKKWLRLTLPE